jgi:hypothetical protein
MDKNLIKIEGIYNNLTSGEKFNIFCTMTINLKNYQVNIKNCEVDQNDNKNLIQFDEQVYILIKDTLAHNTLNFKKN